MFDSPTELAAKLRASGYLIDDDILSAVYLAATMHRPVLVEGPPGCGKTELAYAVARSVGTYVERMQCYAGINEDVAIGKFDEALQRLFLEAEKARIHGDWDSNPLWSKISNTLKSCGRSKFMISAHIIF
jgi:MoxR-like ATPase